MHTFEVGVLFLLARETSCDPGEQPGVARRPGGPGAGPALEGDEPGAEAGLRRDGLQRSRAIRAREWAGMELVQMCAYGGLVWS